MFCRHGKLKKLIWFLVLILGLSVPISVHAKVKSRIVHFNVATVTQRTNALSEYLKNHDIVNNDRYLEPANYPLHYNHHNRYYRTFRTLHGNEHVTFKPVGETPDNYSPAMQRANNHNSQGFVINNSGVAFVIYQRDSTHLQLVRFRINGTTKTGHVRGYTHYKLGDSFVGGHGQAFGYDPLHEHLWLLTNDFGPSHDTSVLEINQRTLLPDRKINFKFRPLGIGDVLTFDKYGNAYTIAALDNHLMMLQGKITNDSVKFHALCGLKFAPGTITQGLGYNPINDRVYVVTDGEILSYPAYRYGRLKKSDIKAIKLSGHYEFEGLAFYHHHGYLLVHCPSEIMRSKYDF